VGDVNGIPVWILYHDLLLGRKAFAGPYDNGDPRFKADMTRLELADTVTDVEEIRAGDLGSRMPSLKFDFGVPGCEVRRRGRYGDLRVVADWDAVEQAFPGQFVEAIAADGEAFHGIVTRVDVAEWFIWVSVH
jgi:hypothetical protein